MSRPIKSLLNRCLGSQSPRKELLAASLGCVIGSTLILLALQIFADSKLLLGSQKVGRNFVTLNKSVQGGILLNLGKQEESFKEEEIDRIIRDEFKIKRDPEDPENIATLWLVDSKGYLRGVYHAASEDALRDATEDIALLRKEMDIKEHAAKKREKEFKKNPPTPLPILGPEGHTIPSFAFTTIDSLEVSHRDVEGKIKIVDYFFTHCPTICPLLSSQLSRTQSILHKKSVSNEDVIILSHSVDPVRDTPERLSEYAENMNADTSGWKFMTGNKDDLYDQARYGYYLTAMESDTAAGGFFHSDTFVLVDKLDRIRGYYDGTSTYDVGNHR